MAFGTYELRLFSNNTHTLLATSSTFPVQPTVSGSITSGGSALVGVPVSGTNGANCGPSDASGVYGCLVPYGWSGTLTPSQGGYLFNPSSRTHSNVTAHLSSQNFPAASVPQISGVVAVNGSALAGVAIAGTNGASCTAVTNASGQYSCAVPSGWSGSVTPSASGYAFDPASRSYSNVTASQSAQGYAALAIYQLSGTATFNGSPLSGVQFAATNGATCTASNASGQYACSVPQGWSGSVTPSLAFHTFTPGSLSYVSVAGHQSVQNYAAALQTYQVSGTVRVNGVPLADVGFAGTNGATCSASNALGQYSCTVSHGWSGTLTPSASGYTLSPASRSYTNVVSGQGPEDFTATLVSATAPLFYVHADHLNTPRLVADAAGTTVWKWDQQEPFGNNVADENPSGLGAFDLPLRLPGQYFDKETNIHYNYFRNYDPTIGRYDESDPIGLRGGLNTYAYVEGTPLRLTDRFGLDSSRQTVHWGPIVHAASSFWNNYWNMRDAQTPGADRYFHCMANCQAAKRGSVAYGTSIVLSELKEAHDQYVKGYPASDSDADRAANAAGRCTASQSPGTDCKSICDAFRPPSLDPRY